MELSHYGICLQPADVQAGDIPFSYPDQSYAVVSAIDCGVPTVGAAQVYLRPYTSSVDQAEQFADGMTLGWGVVAAMAVAWSIHQLRRAL